MKIEFDIETYNNAQEDEIYNLLKDYAVMEEAESAIEDVIRSHVSFDVIVRMEFETGGEE